MARQLNLLGMALGIAVGQASGYLLPKVSLKKLDDPLGLL